MDYLLALDQGTTGSTALLVDTNLQRVSEASLDFEQIYPEPGWVEHDPKQIWASVVSVIKQVTSKIDPKKIVAIGITNQRETICFWDRKSGEPLANAIVWQDRRTAKRCEELRSRSLEPVFQEATGLLLDPYFSGTKVRWALENWGAVQTAQKQGTLAVGTVDSYLCARLTWGQAHVTEPSNASRTLAFHLTERRFDQRLCEELQVPLEIWPSVLPSAGEFGRTLGVPGLPDGIPITGILGDQQAALLGQACFREGMAKCTFGTGAFLLMNTGSKPARSKHRLLTTVAWELEPGKLNYALEGSAFVAGAAVQWLRDGLGIIKDSSEVEALAAQVDSSDGVVFVPALTGLGAPYWDPHARGLFCGLTRGTRPPHLARAVLEGIAFQNVDILKAMEKDLGRPLETVNVDGGAAANNLMMQFQADVLGVRLRRPKYLETTSLGAVFAAGLGVKVWRDFGELEKAWQEDRSFLPQWEPSKRSAALDLWSQAIARTLGKK
jgi:glycerol kinase